MSQPPEERDYWSLLESSQKQFYPDFVSHLSNQADGAAEEGRIGVIEFHDDGPPSIKRFPSSRGLRRYMDKSSGGAVHRRAFVLEGLPRHLVQVLGAKLRVPLSFFAAHWLGSAAYPGNLLNRTPRHYHHQRRCLLSFQRLHQARIEGEAGRASSDPSYVMQSSAHRPVSRLTVFDDYDGPLSSSEQVSFWSSEQGDFWDAVILVDPPLGDFVRWRGLPLKVEHSPAIRLAAGIPDGLGQEGSWYPPHDLDAAPPPPATEKAQIAHHASPTMRSFFDDVLALWGANRPLHHPLRPTDCLRTCRHIVLLAWTAWLRIIEAQIIQEQIKMYKGADNAATSPADTTPSPASPSLLDTSWTLPWEQRRFSRLVRAKTKLEALDAELYRNMDALGITSANTTGTAPAVSGGQPGAVAGATEEDDAWSADAWRALQKEVQMLKARLEIMSQAYTQAVSVRESIAANEQARQVGLLTSLATLFIPVSLVAAVFSMGGPYAAGERLFWVYWVVAVPVVAAGCLLLFTRLGRAILRRGAVNGLESLV